MEEGKKEIQRVIGIRTQQSIISGIFLVVLISLTSCGTSDEESSGSTTRTVSVSISCTSSTNCVDANSGDHAVIMFYDSTGSTLYLKEIAATSCSSGTCTASITSSNAKLLPSSASGTSYVVKSFIDHDDDYTLDSGEATYQTGETIVLYSSTSSSATLDETGSYTWTDQP